MNIVIISGRLTRDPELRETVNGKATCSFSVAVQKSKDAADFINCVAWETTAENITKHFRKGNPILITGRLETRSYEKDGQKRTFTQVNVSWFEFMGGGAVEKDAFAEDIDDDIDLPF